MGGGEKKKTTKNVISSSTAEFAQTLVKVKADA